MLVADMTVGYKALRETFTSHVVLKPAENIIDVTYVDGPFRYLDNRWRSKPTEDGGTAVHFFIDYEFKSRILGAMMGAMFDRAFRMFAEAFEKRADEIYRGSVSLAPKSPITSAVRTVSDRIWSRPAIFELALFHPGRVPLAGNGEPDQPDRLFRRCRHPGRRCP